MVKMTTVEFDEYELGEIISWARRQLLEAKDRRSTCEPHMTFYWNHRVSFYEIIINKAKSSPSREEGYAST